MKLPISKFKQLIFNIIKFFLIRIKYVLQRTALLFTRLIKGNHLLVSNASARISVGVFARLLVS